MKITLEAENRQDILAAMRYISTYDTFPPIVRVPTKYEELITKWLNQEFPSKSGPVINTNDVKLTKEM